MVDCEAMVSESEREENLIAAANHIVRVLGSKKNLTKDEMRVLADLGSRLSSMVTVDNDTISEPEKKLNAIQEKIMYWETDQSMIWDVGQDEGYEYLNAVEEVSKLIEWLEKLSSYEDDDEQKELLRKAQDVFQIAMARLEEEFTHMLVQNTLPFEPDAHMSFRSCEDDVVAVEDIVSVASFSNDSVDYSSRRNSTMSRSSEDVIIDLIHPDAIPDLKSIASLMCSSSYTHECTQSYISVRKDALDECLFNLEMEKLSIEEVLKMDWHTLNSKIKRWVRVIKTFIRVYLASEKSLSDQVFSDLGSDRSAACFADASKASMLQLLNFGEAISVGPHQPEKLFRIIDMYEVLADLLPEVDALFSDQTGLLVRIEYHEVMKRLGECVKSTFLEFENVIASNTSTNPFAGGGVHPLTRYVMNYIKALTGYNETLNLLLLEDDNEVSPPSVDEMMPVEVGPFADEMTPTPTPVVFHFNSIASILESNLTERSKLYKDPALQHLFLMNNIHYVAQKAKTSELQHVFGNDWIRKRNARFQHHASDYERATWTSVLSSLMDGGNSGSSSGSGSVSKSSVKERFRNFYVAFEEIYKVQSTWLIPDQDLREDLQIKISALVIRAYQLVVSRHNNHISDKHIKYSSDELQSYLLDLFEGSPKSLHYSNRR